MCARYETGRVACWGRSPAVNNNESRSPIYVPDLDDIVEVAIGSDHACALRRNGRVRCWGDNEEGQLGRGYQGGLAGPQDIEGLEEVSQIAAAGNFSYAMVKTGDGYCWGAIPFSGSSAAPQWFGTGSSLIDLSVNTDHVCVVHENSTIFCPTPSFPRVQNELFGVVDLVVRLDGACAIVDTGDVFCWDDDTVRDGTKEPTLALGIIRPKKLFGTGSVICVLEESGRVLCWGNNEMEYLGHGRSIGFIHQWRFFRDNRFVKWPLGAGTVASSIMKRRFIVGAMIGTDILVEVRRGPLANRSLRFEEKTSFNPTSAEFRAAP